MVKQAAADNRHRLWLFGKSWDFHVVTTDVEVGEIDYHGTAANPARRQKSQIVLHCTAGNGSAEQVLSWWANPMSLKASANYIVERTNTAQAARPASGAPAPDVVDDALVDAVRVLDDDIYSYHGGNASAHSIGIEHSNVGWAWYMTSAAREPSLAGRHTPFSTCPAPTNVAPAGQTPSWRCNHARPQDLNRFISLSEAVGGHTDYQAYQEEQYTTMILLLRHLCITHRIPRQFLGRTRDEVYRHWLYGPPGAERRVNRSYLYHFRGIFHHRNCHRTKACPGVIHRNRLYRGIIDEWWLPVQLDGSRRDYYSGPFRPLPWEDGVDTEPAFFRGRTDGVMEGTVFRDADHDALIDTTSYFDLDSMASYYAAVETRLGGIFPIGVNKSWHGGVHLQVRESNPFVYAAASGTVVAARVSSNPDTDRHRKFGSQRFVLVRHAVHLATQDDPEGVGERIDYDADPVYLFTLYMHFDPVPSPNAEDAQNPPWFNLWRRDNAGVDVGMDGEKGRVFFPDQPVAVGDILGRAGFFRGRRMVHFEVIGHRDAELTMAPWDQVDKSVVDEDQNVMCDVDTLDRFLLDLRGDGIDAVDILRAAPELRHVKALHKSEWSLDAEDQIKNLVPHAKRRKAIWPHFERFSWLAEAIAACPDLETQLGDRNGMLWHYHPFVLMEHVNRLILEENREIEEEEYSRTNVVVDGDDFITDLVRWNAVTHSFDAANADRARVRPVSSSRTYHFNRREISCRATGNHAPGPTPPQSTRFSLALLQALERIRVHFNRSVDLELSHVCAGHQDATPCALGTTAAATAHANGVAADIAPSAASPARCASLWRSVAAILDPFDRVLEHHCGSPTEADLPTGYDGVTYQAHPASAQAKLTATPPEALTGAEAAAFRIHIELTPATDTPERESTAPLPVRLRVTFTRLDVLDDQDWFGAGEWDLQAHVNTKLAGSLDDTEARSNTSMSIEWPTEVELDPDDGDVLHITATGIDHDVFGDDSLGEIDRRFDQSSQWGIGTHTLTSSNGSFALTFTVESLNDDF